MTNDPLDTAIDSVAHEMTAGDPYDAALFRRRVLAGIDSAAGARGAWRPAWVLPALAAAAAIAIAIALLRPAGPKRDAEVARPFPPREQAVGPAERTPVQSAPEMAGRPNAIAARLPAPRLTAGSVDTPYLAASPPDAFAPKPLAVAPLAVEPIGIARLQPADPIQTERLDPIAPISVTPIDLDDSQRRQE